MDRNFNIALSYIRQQWGIRPGIGIQQLSRTNKAEPASDPSKQGLKEISSWLVCCRGVTAMVSESLKKNGFFHFLFILNLCGQLI